MPSSGRALRVRHQVNPARPWASLSVRPSPYGAGMTTYADLQAYAESLGLTVECDAHLAADRRGDYNHSTRTIRINRGLSDRMAIPVLLHELEHHFRGDTCKQDGSAEQQINRVVACRLISMEEYRVAEEEADGSLWGIAVILQWPIWLVEAYQATLHDRGVRPPAGA